MDESVNIVISVAINALGGEIFIPKIPSYNIVDLAEATILQRNCRDKAGEKIHEEMITPSDSFNTYDWFKLYYYLLIKILKTDI